MQTLNSSDRKIIYKAWNKMKNKDLLCEEWAELEPFLKWAIENNWKKGLQFKRKDQNQKASPENCFLYSNLDKKFKPLYQSWHSMLNRHPGEFCQEWLDFKTFKNWAVENGWQKGFNLERRDRSKSYFPENCYYTNLNKSDRKSRLIEYWGEKLTLEELSQRSDCEVDYDTLSQRIFQYDIKPELAVQKNLIPKHFKYGSKIVIAYGESKTVDEWLKDDRCKVGRNTLTRRIFAYNINPEKALATNLPLNRRFFNHPEEINNNLVKELFKKFKVLDKLSDCVSLSGIYGIVNTVNGKIYIGQSIRIHSRLIKHINELNAGIHANKHLQAAWNKYGEKSFAFIIIEEIVDFTVDLLKNKEEYWVSFYKTNQKTFGYNKRKVAESNADSVFKPLTVEKIKEWIHRYKKQYGKFPNTGSGTISYDEETASWKNINFYLQYGCRGLPKGPSLKKLIKEDFLGETYQKKTLPKGLYFDKFENRFRIIIVIMKKGYKIGTFKSESKAIKANELARSLFEQGKTIEEIRLIVRSTKFE